MQSIAIESKNFQQISLFLFYYEWPMFMACTMLFSFNYETFCAQTTFQILLSKDVGARVNQHLHWQFHFVEEGLLNLDSDTLIQSRDPISNMFSSKKKTLRFLPVLCVYIIHLDIPARYRQGFFFLSYFIFSKSIYLNQLDTQEYIILKIYIHFITLDIIFEIPIPKSEYVLKPRQILLEFHLNLKIAITIHINLETTTMV